MPKHSFTAIDFETAHPKGWSICQVGLVRVEEGEIVNELSMLVQPPDNFYWPRFIQIHGIKPSDTAHAPKFNQAWEKIAPFISEQNVVAHNGFGFDFPVLHKTLEYYQMNAPAYQKFCTYKIFKKKLSLLCQEHRITLNHHDALSDAKACAKLFLLHLNQ
ncbi:MAG: 3'-5' exonuclease [Bacteroidota bacterium]